MQHTESRVQEPKRQAAATQHEEEMARTRMRQIQCLELGTIGKGMNMWCAQGYSKSRC